MTFDEAESALDAGKLEMMRPWGDYVPVRRAGKEFLGPMSDGIRWRMIPVRMEADVLSTISEAGERLGMADLRIAP